MQAAVYEATIKQLKDQLKVGNVKDPSLAYLSDPISFHFLYCCHVQLLTVLCA